MKMAKCLARRDGTDKAVEDSPDLEMLLHPELLSHDFIAMVLKEKKISVGEDVKGDRDQLTQAFVQHVTPKPQRELPDSRWGRRVERRRPAHPQTHSSCSSRESTGKRPLIVFDGSSTHTGTVKLRKAETTPADRLKPPPSPGNFTNPIRKLSSPPSVSSSPRITVSSPGQTPRSPPGTEPPKSHMSQMVKLKRVTPSEGDSDSSSDLKSPEVKKKIHPITWP